MEPIVRLYSSPASPPGGLPVVPQLHKKRIKHLKAATARHILRVHKKVAKAHANKCSDTKNTDALRAKLLVLREFEDTLMNSSSLQVNDAQRMAQQLGFKEDLDPTPRVQKQVNNKTSNERLPYRAYISKDGVEIFVGKQAKDNDLLSTSDKHRKKSEWWLHASGCPGSHVVIKCSDEVLPAETMLDAAVLAARHSKFAAASTVKVSLTRCRNVSKEPGSPAGQVTLKGEVKQIRVSTKMEKQRLVRLDETCPG
jgi:predicted ribosome quality control (RQC) complex YloA/Tae2 family protein